MLMPVTNTFCADRRIGLVNVIFICKTNAMQVDGAGGEGKCTGRKAVGFEQET